MASAGGCPSPPPPWWFAPQACLRSEVCHTACALTTTSSPPLLLAPQVRWRRHAVLALLGPRRLDCSFARQQVRGAASHTLAGVLTRCAHTARSRTRRTHNSTPRLRRCGRILSSPEAQARSDQIIALPSVPRLEGRWATAPRLNCEVRGQLLPLDLRQARRVGRVWCAVLASHPLRRSLSTDPAHNQFTHAACTRAQPTRWPTACLLLGRRRALETVDAEVDDAGSTMPPTAPAAVVSLATAA